jgi:hypothetical protein
MRLLEMFRQRGVFCFSIRLLEMFRQRGMFCFSIRLLEMFRQRGMNRKIAERNEKQNRPRCRNISNNLIEKQNIPR